MDGPIDASFQFAEKLTLFFSFYTEIIYAVENFFLILKWTRSKSFLFPRLQDFKNYLKITQMPYILNKLTVTTYYN